MHWTHPTDCPSGDPYFAWAQASHWRGFRRLLGQRLGTGEDAQQPPPVRILVQAASAALAQQAIADYETANLWRVAQVYKGKDIRHFVADLDPTQVPHLAGLSQTGLRWELALPFRDAETAARAQVIGAYGETRQATDFQAEPVFTGLSPRGGPPTLAAGWVPLEEADHVMAVIDFGFPFLNKTFRDGQDRCRVRALWDQGTKWQAPANDKHTPWTDATDCMGYGRQLTEEAIRQLLQEYLRSNPETQDMDEPEAYRRIDYLIDYDDARRRVWAATHGSHVASVAAGQVDPLGAEGQPMDAAGQAPVVLVQLPALTAADSGGGSLSAQVLDAVHYVIDVCRPGAHIVLTLSYGSLAGPHDGSSLIEAALDELIEWVARQGGSLVMVLGAGNSREAACHVQRTVRPERSALLRVGLAEGDYTDTYVETWFQPDSSLLNRVRARVRTGDGDWSPWVGVGQAVELVEGWRGAHSAGRPMARLSFQGEVPNGSKPLLLLALAPTARPADDDGPLAAAGPWQIEVALEPEPPVTGEIRIDAWVERDDPGWLGFGVQARFEEQRLGDDQETLSSLASGQHTVVAGGFCLSNAQVAPFSALGTRKAGQPLVYAACAESEWMPTVRGAATRSGDSLRMSGTSVAAPVLARCLYNWMVANPHANMAPAKLPEHLKLVIQDELDRAPAEGRPPKLRWGPA